MARTVSVRAGETLAQEPAHYRPIDLVHLAKQTLGDRGLELEILRLFDQSSKTLYQRLVDAQTREERVLNMHSLKGAAAGIGAYTIADIARGGEAALNETGKVDPEVLSDLGVAVEEVSVFIADLLED